MVEQRSTESKGLRFNSKWELRIFSLFLARDKKKDVLLYFFTQLPVFAIRCEESGYISKTPAWDFPYYYPIASIQNKLVSNGFFHVKIPLMII